MRLLPLLCVALLAAGCYDSRFGERGDDATPEPVTATIRQLREKFAGTTFPVTGDIVVSGRVTTSDYDENFLPHVLHRRGRSGDRGHGGA